MTGAVLPELAAEAIARRIGLLFKHQLDGQKLQKFWIVPAEHVKMGQKERMGNDIEFGLLDSSLGGGPTAGFAHFGRHNRELVGLEMRFLGS